MTWIDYTIIGVLTVAVAGIIVYLVKEKRKGKSGCGCGCGDCPHAGSCGVAKPTVKREEGTDENA